MSDKPLATKPLLRGHIHQGAFFVSLGATAMLIAKSSNQQSFTAAVIYSFSLLLLFGISAVYHRFHWEPPQRALMKRLDHSAIFILIAGTFTPVALLAMPNVIGHKLLWIIWSAAVIGVMQSIFWVKAPAWFSALFYVGIGWIAAPYLGTLKDSVGISGVGLLLAGGIVYTVGAVFYALKKPKLIAHIFGYHELFHLMTIFGAALHFIVIYSLIK